jgi:outer membrane protein OmpA-like peptidoglycan-associated protein
MRRLFLLAAFLLCLLPAAAQTQTDAKGCTDHPLLSRMPGYWIRGCDHKQFNAWGFFNGKAQPLQVEGEFWFIQYYPRNDLTSKPSEIQILRNYKSALQKHGATVVAEDKNRETLKFVHGGQEIWVQVDAPYGSGAYFLRIVQKGEMQQDIVADAAALQSDLQTTGHAAIYGIYFDTNKSDIKPESKPALDEIAKLLKQDPALKLKVVGHTDMTGLMDANMKLSQARAEAVVQFLVTQHAIAAARLKGYGVGPLAPVATNDTDEGRAKNRRVELVKE